MTYRGDGYEERYHDISFSRRVLNVRRDTMRELVLKWLPILGWIAGGTLLLPGIVVGIYHSVQRIFGYSHDEVFASLGRVPLSIQAAGTGSLVVTGAWLWVSSNYSEKTTTLIILAALIVGGVLGALLGARMSGVIGLLVLFVATVLPGFLIGIKLDNELGAIIIIAYLFLGYLGFLFTISGIVLPVTRMLDRILAVILTPLLSLVRFRTVICRKCLRYTQPFFSRYTLGKRYCEHCQHEVERTQEVGKLIFTFGILLDKPVGKSVFVLLNPDLEHKETPFDVSEVYIDTKTCEPLLLERFITHVINYPPKYGVPSVRIFYRGELDDLGENLKNALRNTFRDIEKIG